MEHVSLRRLSWNVGDVSAVAVQDKGILSEAEQRRLKTLAKRAATATNNKSK